MNVNRDPDLLIKAFLDDGLSELPDRSYDSVRSVIDDTRQRVVFGPWREQQMTNFAKVALAAAAVALVAVVGIRFLPEMIAGPGAASIPTSLITAAPTPTPVPTPTPIADRAGRLSGTYVAHPFREPNRAMSFTFTVPFGSWDGTASPGRMIGMVNDSAAIGFLRVSSLNSDPCNSSGTADDVAIGTTVDDLVSALTLSTEYETSVPTDVTLGGYTGKQVIVTMPNLGGEENYATDCDDQQFQIWNGEGFTIHSQGPGDRWHLYILDVEGDRVVVLARDFEFTGSNLRQELQSIVDSIEITAP